MHPTLDDSYREQMRQKRSNAATSLELELVDHGFRGAGAAPNINRVLLSLIAWVEEGQAPDQLLGESRDAAGKVTRTRPIFPYPQTARFAGTGDPSDARNFVTQSPTR